MLISYHKSFTYARYVFTVDSFYSVTQFKFIFIAIKNLFNTLSVNFSVARMYSLLPDSACIIHIF